VPIVLKVEKRRPLPNPLQRRGKNIGLLQIPKVLKVEKRSTVSFYVN